MPVFRVIAIAIAKTLSKVFGLATMSFFGRMPSRDDDKIALIGVASLTWLPIALAIPIPALAELIIPFAPDDETLTRWIAIGLTVAVPLAVGTVVTRMHNNRGEGAGPAARRIVAGFWYTPVIGLTVAAIVVVVPVLKSSYLARRFTTMRIMVMLPSGSYDEALEHLVRCIREQDIDVEVTRPNPVIDRLFRVLAFVLGQVFGRDVADRMRMATGKDADGESFEVTVHPADLTIVGKQHIASKLHAIVADSLDERKMYLTWDDDSQALEDRLRQLRDRLDDGGVFEREEVEQLEDDLRELELEQEEWNAVRRSIYRLDRDLALARLEQVADDDEPVPAGDDGRVPAGDDVPLRAP